MKKKKENVYVVIDTPKKAKKVKKVLDMFGEKYGSATLSETAEYSDSVFQTLFYNEFGKEFWIGKDYRRDGKTEVSIKELRNILAVEHLKEGDVVVTKVNNEKIIAIYDHACKSNLALFQAKRWVRFSDGFKWNNEGCFDAFLRYATEEEKALLEDKPKLEVGKWYKAYLSNKGGYLLAVFNGYNNTSYGIHPDKGGEWFPCHSWFSDFNTSRLEYKEATKEEVEQALIKEAKKRGFVKGGVFNNSNLYDRDHDNNMFPLIGYWFIDNELHLTKNEYKDITYSIFRNGKWAEVVEPSFVESSDKIKVAGENIGKRVRVIDGGYGAKGCDGKVGIIVDRSSVDFSTYGGACSTDIADCYIMTDEGYYWGLCDGYELEYIEESSPLTVSLEIKDIATLQVIQKTLKELEEKLTKLI